MFAIAMIAVLQAPVANAQTPSSESRTAEAKPAEIKPPTDLYQIIYLTNLTDQNTANDIQTDLRNMLPKTKVYYLPSQGALTLRGSAEDIQLAQKIVSELDKPRKTYRLAYTISESEGGKAGSSQHFSIVVLLGNKTSLKQGSRVPIVTGSFDSGTSQANTQVQYIDLGLNIEASLEGTLDGFRLHTKIEQSSPSDEKSGVGAQDPIIRQSVLDSTASIVLGKPVVLGSLDIPGTIKHQEVEVVSELVK